MILPPKVWMSTLSLIFFISKALSQEVSNVQGQFNSGTVVVTYDLAKAVPTYFVELLYSADQGMTFSEPLKLVSGDVRLVNSGQGKSITWNAEKELGSFSGEMIFRIRATAWDLPNESSPDLKIFTADKEKFTVEIKEAVLKNDDLSISLIFNSRRNTYLGFYAPNCYIMNARGVQQEFSSIRFGGKVAMGNNLSTDSPVEVKLMVSNYSEELIFIPKLILSYNYGDLPEGEIVFEKIPVNTID